MESFLSRAWPRPISQLLQVPSDRLGQPPGLLRGLRHSASLQQRLDLAAKDRQFCLDDVPHEAVVYLGVAVDQDVAQRDDAEVLADTRG